MNKQEIRNIIIFTTLMLAAFLLWGNGIYKQQYLRDNYESYSIRMKTEEITSQALSNALEAEQSSGIQQLPIVCAWNYVSDQNIKNEILETNARANLYEIYGEIKLASTDQLMRGYFPDTADYESCVISNTLAYELFRTDNVLGNIVKYQNKSYTIKGIVKENDETIFIRIKDENKIYQNIEILYEDNENAKQLVTSFLTKNAWTDSCIVLNRNIYMNVLGLLGTLPVWLIAFLLSAIILREIWKRRRIPIQFIALLLVFLTIVVILRWGCNLYISIPEELIPTKWSDFNFWVMKFNEIEENIRAATFVRPVPKDVLFTRFYIRGVHYDLLGTICIVLALIYEKFLLKARKLLTVSISICILEALAIAILFSQGIIFDLNNGYLFSLPLYFVFHYIKRMLSTINDGKEKNMIIVDE